MATCIGPVCFYPKSVCLGKRCVKRDIQKERITGSSVAVGGILAAGIITQTKVASKVVSGALPVDVIESSKIEVSAIADDVPQVSGSLSGLVDWSHGMFWMPDEWQEYATGPIA